MHKSIFILICSISTSLRVMATEFRDSLQPFHPTRIEIEIRKFFLTIKENEKSQPNGSMTPLAGAIISTQNQSLAVTAVMGWPANKPSSSKPGLGCIRILALAAWTGGRAEFLIKSDRIPFSFLHTGKKMTMVGIALKF